MLLAWRRIMTMADVSFYFRSFLSNLSLCPLFLFITSLLMFYFFNFALWIVDYLLSSFILTLGVSLPLVFHCVFSKRQTNLQERAYLHVRGMQYINEWRQPRLRKTAPRVPNPCDDLLLKLQRLRAERSAAKCDVQSLLYAIGNARSWQSRFKKEGSWFVWC